MQDAVPSVQKAALLPWPQEDGGTQTLLCGNTNAPIFKPYFYCSSLLMKRIKEEFFVLIITVYQNDLVVA